MPHEESHPGGAARPLVLPLLAATQFVLILDAAIVSVALRRTR